MRTFPEIATERLRRPWIAHALLIIAAGAVLRVAYALRGGVTYDEVFVMGLGLDEIRNSLRAFVFDVPVRRSDALTPLWWWLQALPVLIQGELSLFGLRILPVLLGTGTLILTWCVAAPRIGRGPALILTILAAGSDVLAFANARGEFAESLLMMAAIPAACLVGDSRRPGLKGILWFAILFTHLGKGCAVVGGLALAEMIALALRPNRVAAERLLAGAAIAILPTVAWLGLANRIVFGAGPIATDAGERRSVWHALHAITLDYRAVKSHMLGSPLDATQVYLDGLIWPLTTLLAVPLAAGVAAALIKIAARGYHSRRHVLVLSVLPWIIVAAVSVIGRGMLGSRFHLLYLPPLWIVAAIGLWRLRRAPPAAIACGLVWVAYALVASSWSGWPPRALVISAGSVLAAGLAAFASLRFSARAALLRAIGSAMVGLLSLALLITAGPWRWGPAARFEPMAGPATNQGPVLLDQIDAARSGRAEFPPPHGRTLYIDLANYFLTKPDPASRDLERAVHYAELQSRRTPDDARAWFYVGLAWQRQRRPVEQVRAAWQRSYDLNPNPRVADQLQKLPR